MIQWFPKKASGLKWAWSGVLAATLCVGCGGGEAQEPTQPLDAQAQQAENDPSAPVPLVQSLDVTPLEDIHSRTKSLIRARLAPGQERLFKGVPAVSDTEMPIVLLDNGTEGDEKPGDGIFSAIAEVDLENHRKTQERIRVAQERQPNEPLTFAVFNNRALVEERKLSPLSPDIFVPGRPIPVGPVALLSDVRPNKSLIITHSGVINDPTRTYDPCTNTGNPNGVWTFNHLMTEMASTFTTPANLTQLWLQKWATAQTINGWTVPARTSVNARILTPWPKIGGQLDMTKAAFKLVAIVNRLDLGKGAGSGGYSGSSGGGELRFVFAAVDRSLASCPVRELLVIFEYNVPKTRCTSVRTWAQDWLALSDPLLVLGSPAYNAALENLTEQVVVAGAEPAKPHGNAINQIRTNDFMLGSPWELREFHLNPGPAFLTETETVLTPGDLRNNQIPFRDFVNTNEAAILANTYTVPATFAGLNFLGANPRIPTPSTTFWRHSGILNNDARHKFSLNTCNGCHARETSTPDFTHISETGVLSPFLATGMSNPLIAFNVTDPVSFVSRPFFEIRDRAQHLDSVANQSCITRLFDIRMRSPH